MQAWIDEIFQRRREELDRRWQGACYMLLFDQAEAEGRRTVELGEQVRSYVPEHRRAEEEERIRQELQERKSLRKRKRKKR
jgi:hypothetical protein